MLQIQGDISDHHHRASRAVHTSVNVRNLISPCRGLSRSLSRNLYLGACLVLSRLVSYLMVTSNKRRDKVRDKDSNVYRCISRSA